MEATPHDPPRLDLLVEGVLDYAIFMLDPQGRVLTWNAGAERLKGYRADEIVGRSFEVFYPPEVAATGWPREELSRTVEDGRFEDEGWRLRKDGSRFWANVVITRLLDESGRLKGFAKITRDLTERRRQEEAVRRSEEQFRLLLESVADYAIFLLDPDGNVMTWNQGAQSLKGYTADEVAGRHFSMFFTPDSISAAKPQAELDEARTRGRVETEGWRVRKDGSAFWAKVVMTSVRDAEGRLRGFAKVTRDLSDQRRLGELERAGRRMSEFLAMLGHELRNPLAPLRNAVSLMQRLPDLPASLATTREIMDRQLGQLTRLVDDLLDAGRIATGKVTLRPAPLDLRRVARIALQGATPLIEARHQQLAVDLPPSPVVAVGDETRLVQVLQNLLTNAAKYTPEGGHIELAIRTDGRASTTRVADSGRGIDPSALEDVFTLFYQEPGRGSPEDSGLGIGLSLVRALVEAHGGRITAHSRGIGHGSTFEVVLPALHDPTIGSASAVAGREAGPSAVARRVLVVDDNADSADTMSRVLELLGHSVCTAYGAQQALGQAAAFAPEIALIDLNLPDGDGISLGLRLRERLSDRVILAAMTAHGQSGDREATRAAGFAAHLTKPVELQALQSLLAMPRDGQP